MDVTELVGKGNVTDRYDGQWKVIYEPSVEGRLMTRSRSVNGRAGELGSVW